MQLIHNIVIGVSNNKAHLNYTRDGGRHQGTYQMIMYYAVAVIKCTPSIICTSRATCM